MTELQGGVNTISANRPLYPFKEDIAQWLWTTFGAGADRVMFWELNSHSWGGESGEWSLLDLQNQPSERLETASKVARVINQHAALFDNSHAAESPITIILSLETMTQQEWAAQAWTVTSTEAGKTTRPPGRDGMRTCSQRLPTFRPSVKWASRLASSTFTTDDWQQAG